MPEFVDITGHKYGRLLAVEYHGKVAHGKHAWRCVCDCGAETVVSSNLLRRGTTTSCGCYMREVCAENGRKAGAANGRANGKASAKHGHTGSGGGRTPTYRSWQAMKDRCDYPGTKGYRSHGAKGVTVCARWRDFRNFLADMGERPAGTSLDRINPFGNYEPRNCRWATAKLQRRNTRVNWLKRATARRAIAARLHSGMCA